eukprot:1177893-Prorocentrum_minimum.AAC.3
MDNSSHDGIQALLQAEQEAQRIVSAARTEKAQRLKQAREEAEREVVAYKAELEEKHQNSIKAQGGDSSANVERLDVETKQKIAQVQQKWTANNSAVVDVLLSKVRTVVV